MRSHLQLFRSLLILAVTAAIAESAAAQALPQLKVSDNRRFLVTADGKPFFWLGDTAWELFHRARREDAERYLHKRSSQQFTVIQAGALAEFDGLREPNACGQTPLVGDDPTRLFVVPSRCPFPSPFQPGLSSVP